eukprot:2268270-Rhodomonas_salina.1
MVSTSVAPRTTTGHVDRSNNGGAEQHGQRQKHRKKKKKKEREKKKKKKDTVPASRAVRHQVRPRQR